MKLMANKAHAKKVMKELGLPVIPEIKIDSSDIESGNLNLKEEDFPLLIKAAYGGGGKGIRVASDKKEFLEMIKKAAIESEKAFGSSELYVERFLHRPKHIEFQIIADKHGNVKVFYERDCTVQRKNQKIIEETPYEEMERELREDIMEKIAHAVKKLGYYNAGTLEFLYDDGRLYFMEMNTRLQVEHPITEEIYDVDLVKAQVLVEAGEKLPEEILDAEPEGHAIEFRINAENPDRDFAPSPGKIEKLHFPGGRGVRVDSHLYEGYVVPPYYDSLLGKIIVHAKTRNEAIKKGMVALRELRIEGISTNADFLLKILQTGDYLERNIYTRYVEEVFMAKAHG